jgi:hypothetical protein
MSDRIQYLISDTVALFGFSLVFGGFLALPIFAGWFYAIWRTRFSSRFFWLWIPLFLTSIALVALFGYHLKSVFDAYGRPPESSGGGPISVFPNLTFPSSIPPIMLIFSSVISPVIFVFTLCTLRLRNKTKNLTSRCIRPLTGSESGE